MPRSTVVTGSTAAHLSLVPAQSPSLVCTWKEGCYGAAWIHLAGELDGTTAPKLGHTLQEAQRDAFLVVLDLRELTFIDRSGMQAIVDATGAARREGGQVVLVRGPVEVDRVFKMTRAREKLMILDLDPNEVRPSVA